MARVPGKHSLSLVPCHLVRCDKQSERPLAGYSRKTPSIHHHHYHHDVASFQYHMHAIAVRDAALRFVMRTVHPTADKERDVSWPSASVGLFACCFMP